MPAVSVSHRGTHGTPHKKRRDVGADRQMIAPDSDRMSRQVESQGFPSPCAHDDTPVPAHARRKRLHRRHSSRWQNPRQDRTAHRSRLQRCGSRSTRPGRVASSRRPTHRRAPPPLKCSHGPHNPSVTGRSGLVRDVVEIPASEVLIVRSPGMRGQRCEDLPAAPSGTEPFPHPAELVEDPRRIAREPEPTCLVECLHSPVGAARSDVADSAPRPTERDTAVEVPDADVVLVAEVPLGPAGDLGCSGRAQWTTVTRLRG